MIASIATAEAASLYYCGWVRTSLSLWSLTVYLVVFSKMLVEASTHGLICGLLPHANPGGFCEKSRNFEWMLSCFENLSGMKISFHKGDPMTFNIDEQVAKEFSQIFYCLALVLLDRFAARPKSLPLVTQVAIAGKVLCPPLTRLWYVVAGARLRPLLM